MKKRNWTTSHRNVPAPPGFLGCTRCGQVKPETDFYMLKRGKRHSWCKSCKLAKNRSIVPRTEAAERFWSKVDKDRMGPGCWHWIGAKRGDGYGLFWMGGSKLVSAHRMSLELHGVKLPPRKEMVVDHLCYDPSCVNPKHLRLVTERDNTVTYARRTPRQRRAA